MVRVDGGDQLEVGVAHDHFADGGAHAAGGAEDPDPDHALVTEVVSAMSVTASSSNGPTRATTRSLPRTRSATR